MQEKLLYFLIGAAGGAIATYCYMKQKHAKQIQDIMDSSIEEIEKANSKLQYIADMAGFDVIDLEQEDDPTEYDDLVNQYLTDDEIAVAQLKGGIHAINLDKEAEEAMAEVQHPRDSDEDDIFPEYAPDAMVQEQADLDDKAVEEAFTRAERIVTDGYPAPYCITEEAYDQNMVEREYEIIELTYFEIDSVLIDDSETPVSQEETIGDIKFETHWGFGGFPKDTFVVRNERKQVDYVVSRIIGAYGKEYYPDRPGEQILDEKGRIIRKEENQNG